MHGIDGLLHSNDSVFILGVHLRGDSIAIVRIRVVVFACKVMIREDVEVCVGLAVGLKDGAHGLGRPAWHGQLLYNDLQR